MNLNLRPSNKPNNQEQSFSACFMSDPRSAAHASRPLTMWLKVEHWKFVRSVSAARLVGTAILALALQSCGRSSELTGENEKLRKELDGLKVRQAQTVDGRPRVNDIPVSNTADASQQRAQALEDDRRRIREEERQNAAAPKLRPDLDGQLLQKPGDAAVYWIEGGKRRHVVTPQALDRLFDKAALRADSNVDNILLGSIVNDGTLLVRCSGEPAVYFLDEGKKRWVSSERAMKKFHLNWSAVGDTNCIVLKAAPDGDPIN